MSSPLITLVSVWCMLTFLTGYEVWKYLADGPSLTLVFHKQALKDLDTMTEKTGSTSRGDLILRALQAYGEQK